MIFYNEKIFKRCFNYKGKYWYKNIKYIPLYFKLMHHLIKYGYDEYATWETFNWFIDTMKSILPHYKNHMGVPIVIDNYTEEQANENEVKWYGIIDRMVELLDLMDEQNVRYEDSDYKWQDDEMNRAKNEFFELFSKYFYNLWD
jgi:hypothetical protein